MFIFLEVVGGAPSLAATGGLDYRVLKMEKISRDFFSFRQDHTPVPSQKTNLFYSELLWERGSAAALGNSLF